MKHISKFSVPQRKGLYEMLKTSTNKTPHEKRVYAELREYFAEKCMLQDQTEVLILDGYIKEINKDKFGEDYRCKWTRIKETGKGFYFLSAYQRKRIYLENYEYINLPFPNKIWRFKISDKRHEAQGVTWDEAFKNWNDVNGFSFTSNCVNIYESLIIL